MDTQLSALAEQGILAVLDHLWVTKYVPALNEDIQRAGERRSDAFSDASFTTCGEPLRQMTPRDLVHLDGMDNVFVAGGAEPTEVDVAFFLWALHETNDASRPVAGAWRRSRLDARLRTWVSDNGLPDAVLEIFAYLDRIFIDLPSPALNTEKKPPVVHCVAPLLVDVAATIGPRDPMSGRMLGETPIPRLIQYRRAAELRKGTKNDYTAMDSARVACMAEANDIMREHRESAATNQP